MVILLLVVGLLDSLWEPAELLVYWDATCSDRAASQFCINDSAAERVETLLGCGRLEDISKV
jgi:hypothetical protein